MAPPSDSPRGVVRVFAAALRGVGWAFVVLVLLLAGAAIYVYRAFGPEQARDIAVGQLQALLHREVSIERLVLTPKGIKVRGLKVRSGRADGELLECESALVTIKLRPLLERRVELDAVRLDSPRIVIARGADGVWDLADVFISTGPAPAKPGGPRVHFEAAEIFVDGAKLRVDDRRAGRRFAFDAVALRLKGLNPDQPFPVSASFVQTLSFSSRSFTSAMSVDGSLALAGFSLSSATLKADRFTAEVDGALLSGSFTLRNFLRPSLEATVSAPALGAERWRRWTGRELALSLPPTRWSGRLALPEPGRLEVGALEVRTPAGVLTATGTATFAGEGSQLAAWVSAKDVDLEKTGAWLPSWGARAPRGRATARATLAGWPGRLQAREAEVSLRGFGAAFGPRKVEGLDLDARASDEFAEVKAEIAKGVVHALGARFDDVSASARVSKQTLTVDPLTFRWGDSHVRLRARVDRLSAPKEVLLTGSVDKLSWEDTYDLVEAFRASLSTRAASAAPDSRPWISTFKYHIPRGFPDTAGRVHVGEVKQKNFWCRDLDVLWSLKGVTPALDKVGGEARVRFGPGRVADIPAVQNANKFLSVVFLPFIYMQKMNNLSVFSASTAYPKTLDFNRIEGEYAASRGVVTTRYFHVDSGQLVAFAEGTTDFGREHVDMDVITRLASTRAPLPEWWVDEAGRPAIGFRVKGDLGKPEPEPRFKKIPVDEIERRLEEARAKGKRRFEAVEKLKAI